MRSAAATVAITVMIVAVGMTPGTASSSPDVARTEMTFEHPTSLPRAAEPLPPGRVVYNANHPGNWELHVMDADGSGDRQLTFDPAYDSWGARLSPDRRTLVFQRTPAGTHDLDYTLVSIWAVGSDGTNPVQLRPAGLDDWRFQGHPEWSPSGRQIVVFGGTGVGPQLQVLDRLGRAVRQITDRPGTNVDPSFSPNGKKIVFVGCPQAECYKQDYEIFTVPLAGGAGKRLTRDKIEDHDPSYAPDGSGLAWVSKFPLVDGTAWDVRISGVDGSNPRRLVGDDGLTSRPEWSRDSTKIYFHRRAPDDTHFDIYEIRPDGSGLLQITTGTGGKEYPST
jgi:Tol biopolymer transport system component